MHPAALEADIAKVRRLCAPLLQRVFSICFPIQLGALLEAQEAKVNSKELLPNERTDAADALLSLCKQVHPRVLSLVGDDVRWMDA